MDNIRANFMDAVFEDEHIYFFENLLQAFCKADINSYEVQIIAYYSGKSQFFIQKIFLVEDKFYMIDPSSLDMLIYNRKDISKCDLFLVKSPIEYVSRQVRAFLYEKHIYFVPLNMNEEIICFQTKPETYCRNKSIKSAIGSVIADVDNSITCPTLNDNNLYFIISRKSFYIKYNLKRQRGEVLQIGKEKMQLICCDGENMWATEEKGSNILIFGSQNKIIALPEIHSKFPYSRINSLNKFIVVLPRHSDNVVLIRKKDFKVKVIKISSSAIGALKESGRSNIINCREYKDCIYLFPYGYKELIIISIQTLETNKVRLCYENYFEKVVERNKHNRNVIEESENFNLIHLLQGCDKTDVDNSQVQSRIGECIWHSINY